MLDYCTPWPAELTSAYRAAGYWAGLPLGEVLSSSADRYGERTAVLDRTRTLTYRQLDSEVNRLANAFLGQGLAVGDRVLVQLPNTVAFVTVCFALFRIGALPVFALPTYRRAEIEYLLTHSGALGYVVPDIHHGFDHRAFALSMLENVDTLRHVFVSGDPAGLTGLGVIASDAEATPARYPPDPADVAFFLLSGGTTALPKLIPRTHDDYVYQARVTARLCQLGPDSAYLAVLPVEFNFTWGCPGVIGVLSTGGKVVLAADPSPRECFALIESEGITMTSVVPTIAHLWVEAAATTPFDLSSLRLVQVGSAPLHRELAERIPAVLRCRLQQVFGMAEGLLTFTRLDDDTETVLGTQGRPVSPADEIRVVDERGTPVPTGTEGELLARGPYTLRGYYRAGEHNAVAFTEDGFYRSGDLVRLTEDGNMIVAGRIASDRGWPAATDDGVIDESGRSVRNRDA